GRSGPISNSTRAGPSGRRRARNSSSNAPARWVTARLNRRTWSIIACSMFSDYSQRMHQIPAVIRPYRASDHAAVYDVCVRTADVGGDARGKDHSDDPMPDLFARPYVFLD